MEKAELVSKTPIWGNSWQYYNKDKQQLVIGIRENILSKYSDGTSDSTSRIKLINDPVRPFWITKPEYRNHTEKKEFEDEDKCDKILCRESELPERLCMTLGYKNPYMKNNLKRLCNSPYVYGADIDVQTLLKQFYMDKLKAGTLPMFTKGALDIETEVTGAKRIICSAFTHENHVYAFALKEYCRKHLGKNKFKEVSYEEFMNEINTTLKPMMDEYGFSVEFTICNEELEIITGTLDAIHKCRTDFISVWNMGYDIPYILNRLRILGVDPKDVFHDPTLPNEIAFVDWHEDKSEADHYTDKWHWFTYSGFSQFIDLMCLYARNRKHKGRESSYSLDHILRLELGFGKWNYSPTTNHWYEQNYNYIEYVIYNIIDSYGTYLLDKKTKDSDNLWGLTELSLPSQYSRQTVMVRNGAFHIGKSFGKLPASAGTNMSTQVDRMLEKTGGAVLPPNKAVNVTVPILKEADIPSQVAIMSVDCDYEAMYPSTTSAFNISKETLLATVIKINGYEQAETEQLFSAVTQPEINAVPICIKFFDMPTYQEMDQLFKESFER